MIEIRTTVRRAPHGGARRTPYERLAKAVLGNAYVLSLVLCGDSLARRINRSHRKKDYAPNVLSFPLGKKEGEIFLNVRKAEREARAYGTTAKKRLALLFVHGLYHLRGHDHGDTMERLEEKMLRRFELL